MLEFGVNLKRFDVSTALGGICPRDDPAQWIEEIVDSCLSRGLGSLPDVRLRLFVPESLLPTASRKMAVYPEDVRRSISIGSQSVYREDVAEGKNFGAFTSHLPAAAVRNMGVETTLVGHSEERADKFAQLLFYDPAAAEDPAKLERANHAVNELIGREVSRALEAGLSVMLCVGETAEEKGGGSEEEQQSRARAVLEDQLTSGLQGAAPRFPEADVVIAYEPRWAIGPGKTPPGPAWIGFDVGELEVIMDLFARRKERT